MVYLLLKSLDQQQHAKRGDSISRPPRKGDWSAKARLLAGYDLTIKGQVIKFKARRESS